MNKHIKNMRFVLIVFVTALLVQVKAQAYYKMPADTVWPGDANGDGVVNEQDILYIGISWGQNGPARTSVSNVWQADSSKKWSKSFRNGTNFNNANCNGDSTISILDVHAVDSNFGLTRAHGRTVDTTYVGSKPDLIIKTNKHTAKPGDTVQIQIYTGSAKHPVDSIYGISFEVVFDTSYINKTKKSSDSFQIGWLGSTSALNIQFSKNELQTKGLFSFACTGNTHSNIIPKLNDTTLLCSMDVVIIDNLSGGVAYINPKLKNVTGLTAHELNLKFNVLDSAEIKVTGIKEVQPLKKLKVEQLSNSQVRFVSDYNIASIHVINMLGQTLLATNPRLNITTLNLNALPTGVYAIELIFEDGTRVTKPMVINPR